jgi:hypothetical protein
LESLLGAAGLVAARRALVGRAAAACWSQSPRCQLQDAAALATLAAHTPLASDISRGGSGLVDEDTVVAVLAAAASIGLRLSPFCGPLTRLVAAFLQPAATAFAGASATVGASGALLVGGSAALRAACARYALQWARTEAPGACGAGDAWNRTLVSVVHAFSLPPTGHSDGEDGSADGDDSSGASNSADGRVAGDEGGTNAAAWVLGAALAHHLEQPLASTSMNPSAGRGVSHGSASSSSEGGGSGSVRLVRWLRSPAAALALETAAPVAVAALAELCATAARASFDLADADAASLWSLLWAEDPPCTDVPAAATAAAGPATASPPAERPVLRLSQVGAAARRLLHVATLEVVRGSLAAAERTHRFLQAPALDSAGNGTAAATAAAAAAGADNDRQPASAGSPLPLLALVSGKRGALWALFVPWVTAESAAVFARATASVDFASGLGVGSVGKGDAGPTDSLVRRQPPHRTLSSNTSESFSEFYSI